MNTILTTFLSQLDPDIIKVIVIIFIIVLVMFFLLTILRKILEHKLKNKILDKGVSENLATSVLQAGSNSDKHSNIKWFAILMGVGMGLFIVNYTLPLGFHSFATMAISIALSFLFYHFYLYRFGK